MEKVKATRTSKEVAEWRGVAKDSVMPHCWQHTLFRRDGIDMDHATHTDRCASPFLRYMVTSQDRLLDVFASSCIMTGVRINLRHYRGVRVRHGHLRAIAARQCPLDRRHKSPMLEYWVFSSRLDTREQQKLIDNSCMLHSLQSTVPSGYS